MSVTVAASIGNMPFATGGSANGPHLVYAKNNNTFWVFWLSSTTTLNAAYWNGTAWTTPTSGATLTLPAAHGSEGRGFMVWSQTIGANDVFYVGFTAQSTSNGAVDAIRAQVGATSLTWGAASSPGTTGAAGVTPMTASIALDSNNKPLMQWQEAGDAHGGVATNADSGSAWTAGWGTDTTFLSGTNQVYGRQVLPGAAGFNLYIIDPGAATSGTGTNTNLDYKYTSTVPTTPSTSMFGASGTMELGDWCGCILDGSNYAVFRRNGTASTLQGVTASVTGNVLSAWSAMTAVPTAGLTFPATQSGIGLCSDGTSNLYLFVIDSGAAKAVKYCVYTKGTTWANGTWGSWQTLEASTQTRNALTACQRTDGSSVWVLWTETVSAGSQYSVVSGQLSIGGAPAPAPMPPMLWPPAPFVQPPAPTASPFTWPIVTHDGYTFPILQPPAGATPISVSDTVTLADSASLAATVPLADSVTLSDAPTIAASVPLAESLTLADTPTVAVSVLLAEILTFADVITAGVNIAVADTITLTDSPALAVSIPLAEAITFAEGLSLAASIPLAETLHLADALGIAVSFTLAEPLSLADSVSVGVPINVSDTISLGDALTVAVSVPIAESLHLTEALAVAVALALTETFHLTDALAILATLTVADVLHLAEQLAVQAIGPNRLVDGTVTALVRDGTLTLVVRDGTVGTQARSGASGTLARDGSVQADVRDGTYSPEVR